MISITIKSLVLISGLTYKSTTFFRWCSRFVQEPLYVECFRCNAVNHWIYISPKILNRPFIIRLGRKPLLSLSVRFLDRKGLPVHLLSFPPSFPAGVLMQLSYRSLCWTSQSLSSIFGFYLPLHCFFGMSMGILRWPYFLMNMNATLHLRIVLLRLITMTCHQWAVDCRASSLSYLSLNCSYSDFFIYAFSGRSESHLLFPSQS